jgi:hypothetical protein
MVFFCPIPTSKQKGNAMAASDYIKLTGNFFFDPATKAILKKTGERYVHVQHDRRRVNKPVSVDRRKTAGGAPAGMKDLGNGLFWDAKSLGIYRQLNGKLTLYSKDRRKTVGPHPAGGDRRKSAS